MFRALCRSIAINVIGIYIITQILSGVITYSGGFKTIVVLALAIAAVNLFIKPVVNLLLLPFNLVTLGVFRWVANLVVLYIATRFVPDVSIEPFRFYGVHLGIIIIPETDVSKFGAFIVASLAFTVVFHVIYWLFQE